MQTLSLYIDGAWRPPDRRHVEPVIDPATEQPLALLPHATPPDLEDALAAAARGFALWRAHPAMERARILHRAAQLLRDRAEEIARIITLEQGKPLSESRGEVGVSADTLDWFAAEGRRAYGRIIPSRASGMQLQMLLEPIGPVAAFCAWNAPLANPVRKVAPALAAGCSVVLKPSEETPFGGIALAQALHDAGLPAGVFNLVFGVPAAVSDHLIASDIIRKVTFTGSVAVGKVLAAKAAARMKQMTMELGGHSPVFIFDDADAVVAARAAVAMKFRNAGQICYSPSRFYAQPGIRDAFTTALVTEAAALRPGSGLDPASTLGPLANDRRLTAMQAFVADALERGATLACGGARAGTRGYFWPPTLLCDVPPDARIASEEPFGPIATMEGFETLEQAIALANRLPYGLAAYAFTRSLANAHAFTANVESGTVGINTFQVVLPETPFGGVKDSGIGREGGAEGIAPYLVSKLACLDCRTMAA